MPTLPTRVTEETTEATTQKVKETSKKDKPTAPKETVAVETEPDNAEIPDFVLPNLSDDGSKGENYGDFYLWNDTIFKAFKGEKQDALNYAEAINSVTNSLDESINVSAMLVPTHIEMGLPTRLKNNSEGITTKSQAEYIKNVYSSFDKSISWIDCYNPLSQHYGDFNYFKTDYHWTALGAYRGYSAFAESKSLAPVSLDSLEKNTVSDFHGSYQAFYQDFGLDYENIEYWDYSNDYSVKIDLINYSGELEDAYSCFYLGSAENNDKYILFLQGSYPVQKIVSTSKKATEDKICIVHQGFSNSIISYFTYNYKEVYAINMDLWEGNLNEYCNARDIKNVLFINDVASSTNSDTISNLESFVY